MSYEPKPRDTSAVALPPEIEALADALARNTHEVWARRRQNEGWTYGEQRNDNLRTTPNMVPYDELSDEERAYDAATSMETLKTIVAMGFQLLPPQQTTLKRASKEEKARMPLWLQRIDDIQPLSDERLALLWSACEIQGVWPSDPAGFQLLVKKLLGRDKPLVGIHAAITGIKRWPGAQALRHLLALGQARSGAARNAQDTLDALLEEDLPDVLRVEALACYGRTYKDLWRTTGDPRRRRDFLELAYHKYHEAYALDGSYFPAINTATLAQLRGDTAFAQTLAARVTEECEALAKADGLDYWLAATLGESALIAQDWARAMEHYAEAARLGAGDYANLDSTRQQALTLLDAMAAGQEIRSRIAELFSVPPVVLLSSASLDGEMRSHLLSAEGERAFQSELSRQLDEIDAAFGYVSASSSSDLVFLEEMKRRVGNRTDQVHLILPCSPEQFSDLTFCGNGAWQARFQTLCRQIAAPRFYGEPSSESLTVAERYARLIAAGLARLQARRLHTQLIPLEIRATRDADRGQAILIEPQLESPAPAPEASVEEGGAAPQQIKAILFADVVGYSKLSEEQIPLFVQHFLQPAADLLGSGPGAPGVRNTWGDALYLVFDHLRDAGNAALKLRDQVRQTDWEKLGMPASLNVRIALHAGLVYPCYDPIIELDTFVGSHVSWAARIEPITPKGEVYASEPFAAIAAAQGLDDFNCDYVGAVPLAKDYGEFVLYHVTSGT